MYEKDKCPTTKIDVRGENGLLYRAARYPHTVCHTHTMLALVARTT